jgi:DNA-binding transcriptional LysR family regulator
MIDWNALQVFLVAAEGGSFSAAARRLKLSQPTVSRQIAALEEQLGARLFLRQARGLELTPAGESVIELAKRMEEDAVTVERRLTGAAAGVEGEVRVSTTEGLGVLWLTERLLPFRQRHPGIRLDLVIDNTAADLARREADIAVRLFQPRQPDLVAKRVGRLGLGLYASTDYLARRGTPQRIEELKDHELVAFDNTPALPPQAVWLAKAAAGAAPAFRSNSLLAQYQAARAGWGIAIAPALLLAGDPGLRRVLPQAPVPALDIWLVVHADLRRSPRIRLVYDELADVFARHRQALAGD